MMRMSRHEADLLLEIIEALEDAAIKHKTVRCMPLAIKLDTELRQAEVDGKTIDQRNRYNKARRGEARISDEELKHRITMLRAGHAAEVAARMDPREENY